MKSRASSVVVLGFGLSAIWFAAFALGAGCGREELDLRPRATGGVGGTGGFATGGVSTGGSATGGFATGGLATGGFATGGRATGGLATGGFATGGVATGGRATGGVSTGGFGTGGRATGGLATGGANTGGMGPSCVWGQTIACACTDGRAGAQTCQQNGMYAPCVCTDPRFTEIQKGLNGIWIGTRSSPWTPTERVALTFDGNGHYTATCAQSACAAPVFYYGIDDDLPTKTYALRDLLADGSASGDIAITLSATPQGVVPGTLDHLRFSADQQRLTFSFWPTWLGMLGPVTFSLDRVK